MWVKIVLVNKGSDKNKVGGIVNSKRNIGK
jgi:hypothetical protein